MKKFLLVLIAMSIMFTGCSLKGILPSACDNNIEESFLCDMADRFDIRVEDIGNGIIILNSILIDKNVYTLEQSYEVVHNIKIVLDDPLSWFDLGKEIKENTAKYPGLYEISSLYINEFMQYPDLPINNFDKELLIGFFNKIEDILIDAIKG